MHQIELQNCGRSMRWYEWLAGLLLLSLAVGVRAESVYKCVDAHGAVTYQDIGCDGLQSQTVVAIAPPPAYAPSPHYALAREREKSAPRDRFMVRDRTPQETAFECRASDGRLFYRLGTCPHSIDGASSGHASKSRGGKAGRAHGGNVMVAARRIPREQACREIHRAGAIGRDGHEFDEQVSTYERNLGHDPCKS